MTKNAIAFYVSLSPGRDRQPITLPDGRTAYIRVEDSGTTDEGDALDNVQAGQDEGVLNTFLL